jgi:hypothetical protein
MYHARLRVALTVGVVTLASACAEHQSAERPTSAAGQRRFVETTPGELSTQTGADSGEPELTPASGPRAARSSRVGPCPTQLPGATLTSLPTLGGTAFVFTTTRESARDELRQRVLVLRNGYVGAVAAPAAGVGLKTGKTIEVHADYLDEPNGARLEVRALHSSDADELRVRLRADAAAMQDEQRCPALGANGAIDSGP